MVLCNTVSVHKTIKLTWEYFWIMFSKKANEFKRAGDYFMLFFSPLWLMRMYRCTSRPTRKAKLQTNIIFVSSFVWDVHTAVTLIISPDGDLDIIPKCSNPMNSDFIWLRVGLNPSLLIKLIVKAGLSSPQLCCCSLRLLVEHFMIYWALLFPLTQTPSLLL